METLIKLDPINTGYRTFVNDQVLTASHLNEVVDYFEDQHRLTRICLNGVGIVCGLGIGFNGRDTISVFEGCAVTTDGDLVKYTGGIHEHYKIFNPKAEYPRFDGLDLLELIPNTEDTEDEDSIVDLEDLDNKVVLLYLEHFEEDVAECTSTNCDTQGRPQHADIKILLIDKDDAINISNQELDPIFDKHNQTKNFLGLPDIDVRRVILRNSYIANANGQTTISNNSNTKNYYRLKESYAKIIRDSGVVNDLKKGVDVLFTDFAQLIDTGSLGTNANALKARIDALFTIDLKTIPLSIQYLYDLLKDLINTYDEIKHLLYDLRTECCPDIESFPKHVLLGELFKEEEYYQCRHRFYPSPIIPNGDEKLQEIRLLLFRFHFILQEYSVSISPNTSIKVTPSLDYDHVLSRRAIPYYYATSKDLVGSWSYYMTNRYKYDQNLAYHRSNLSSRSAIQSPLDHNIDDKDFFRIEGHLGKDYRTAIREIDRIKTEKGLPFDVKALSIDETLEGIDPDQYKCHFEDLNAVLKAWRTEQDCLNAGVAAFFSGFSRLLPDVNKYYPLAEVQTANIAAETEMFLADNYTRRATVDTQMLKASYKDQLCFNPTYYVDTVVDDNLYKDEEVIGSIVNDAIRKNPQGSADEIINTVRAVVDNDETISSWDADTKLIAVEQPYHLLAYAKVATYYIPNAIAEVDDLRIRNYGDTMKALCKYVEKAKKTMTKTYYAGENRKMTTGYERQYALLLNQLSINCCAAEKMEVLLKEIQKRKLEILENKLLSKFVEKHPGLEHKAGVPKGGTFVLVYKGRRRKTKERPNSVIEAEIANVELLEEVRNAEIMMSRTMTMSAQPSDQPMAAEANTITLSSGATIDRRDIEVNTDVARIDSLVLERARDAFSIPKDNITEYTVLADFALPYNCCSDCAPIAFIVPEQPISLRLPIDHICRDEETRPVAFEVVPADGVVTAEIEAGNGGVVLNNGRYFFDVHQPGVPVGEEIRFRVNDQITDCRIIVFEKPQFSVSRTEPSYGSTPNGSPFADVSFSVSSDQPFPEGVAFQWEFGDGSTSTEENPRKRYFLPVNTNNIVNPSLTVTNGRCGHTEEVEEILFEIEASISLEPNTICLPERRTEGIPISMTVTPSNASVEVLNGIQGIEVRDNSVVITPTFNAYGTPLTFGVDGEEMEETLTVGIMPDSHLFCLGYQQDSDGDGQPNDLFLVGASSSETRNWSYEWEVTLFDANGDQINNPEISISNNLVGWDVGQTGSNSATITVVVTQTHTDDFACSQTITETIFLNELPCSKGQFATLNVLKETYYDIFEEFSITNPVLAELRNRILELLLFFTDDDNQHLYQSINVDEAIAIFENFFRDNADWTPSNISTPEDQELFSQLIVFVYQMMQVVTGCTDDPDISVMNEVIQEVFGRFGGQNTGTSAMMRSGDFSAATNTTRLREFRRISLLDLANERLSLADINTIIRRLND